jgi:hypothetical protein
MSKETGFVQVSVDYNESFKALKSLEKQQYPFAYAQTLTQVAYLGQLAVRTRMRWLYNLHTDYLPKGILVEKARKNDIIQYGVAQSIVFSSDKSTPYIGLHETGGVKKPKSGRRVINMPSITLERKGYQTRSGSVKPGLRPSSLLKNYNRSHSPKKKNRKNPQPYIIPERGTQPAIVARRRSASGVGVELLWLFIKTAKIKPTLKAAEAVSREVNQNFTRLLTRNMTDAINTAK